MMYMMYDVFTVTVSFLPIMSKGQKVYWFLYISFQVFKVNFTSIQLYHMDMAEMSTDAISIMSKFLLPALSFLL